MKHYTILIVEDNFSVADTLSRAMQREFGAGTTVEICRTAEAALKMFSIQSFDLLITDWQLPGISGLELILKIRPAHPDLKIVFMTAYPIDQIMDRVRKYADLYLLKPFHIPVLMEHIHHLLSREVEVAWHV